MECINDIEFTDLADGVYGCNQDNGKYQRCIGNEIKGRRGKTDQRFEPVVFMALPMEPFMRNGWCE